MAREARIACNPIASPLLLNTKTTEEKLLQRAKALNTFTQVKDSSTETIKQSNGRLAYVVRTKLMVALCPTFAAKSIDDKEHSSMNITFASVTYERGALPKSVKSGTPATRVVNVILHACT